MMPLIKLCLRHQKVKILRRSWQPLRYMKIVYATIRTGSNMPITTKRLIWV